MPLISVIDDEPSRPPLQSPLSAAPAPTVDVQDDELHRMVSGLYTIPLPPNTNDVLKLQELYTTTLRGIESFLAKNTEIEQVESNLAHLPEASTVLLMEWFAAVGRPPAILFKSKEATESQDVEEQEKVDVKVREHSISLYHATTLQILTLLTHLIPSHPPSPSIPTLLATFTSPWEPWTTASSQLLAKSLLAALPNPNSAVRHILLTTIKPLFSPFTQQTATTRHLAPSLSRISMSPSFQRKAPDPQLTGTDTPIPWIDNRPETLTLLSFILSTSSILASISELIPLILPPLLTLLDYPPHTTYTKAPALRLLRSFINVLPRDYLLPPPKGRGLGEVIWEAVYPYIHWLPPLTPLKASENILGETYSTLIALVNRMYPNQGSWGEDQKERQRRLDKIMRGGIKGAIGYCRETAGVMGVVLEALEPASSTVDGNVVQDQKLGLIRAMGIGSVKHLDFIVSWLGEILSNPFSALQAGLLVSGAIRVLRAIIVQGGAWVRFRQLESDATDEAEFGNEDNIGDGLQWEILRACIHAWRALNDGLESLNIPSSSSFFSSATEEKKNLDPQTKHKRKAEDKRKREQINQSMDELIGLVGIVEDVCVFTDPETGTVVGKDEWETVVNELLEIFDKVEEVVDKQAVAGVVESNQKEDLKVKRRREVRKLLGAEVIERKQAEDDSEVSSGKKRQLKELFGR